MFDGRWRHAVDRTTKPVGQALVRTGITADVLTVFGLVMSMVTAVAIGSGHLVVGTVLLFPTGLPDLFDGPVAKASGTTSIRGAFLAAIFVGLIDTLGRAFLPDLLRKMLSASAASTAAPALSSMLIYLLMAMVLVVRPEGLFPANRR